MSHFTGKKFHDEEIDISAKLLWHGDETMLNDTARYLAEKGFIDRELGSSKAMEEHFKYPDKPGVINKEYYKSLCALFPETTGYRCKTRLFYKERNKKSIKIKKYLWSISKENRFLISYSVKIAYFEFD